MNTTRTVLRRVLLVLLAASASGCIVLPLDPWGGYGRRGGRHYEGPPPVQPHMDEDRRPPRGYR